MWWWHAFLLRSWIYMFLGMSLVTSSAFTVTVVESAEYHIRLQYLQGEDGVWLLGLGNYYGKAHPLVGASRIQGRQKHCRCSRLVVP
ncbi:hypothetical protein C8Q77DRAFT_46144 [Trametes polyzona]|nr:hypothetical protein C8Q77DRAFT_46144 [Trametes polyzona]